MNRSLVFDKDVFMDIVDKDIPTINENEVLINVHSCGICGTDLHIVKSGSGSTDVPNHTTLGHEFCGRIVELGNNVKNYNVGDLVSIDPNKYCGSCEYCLNGRKNMCSDLKAYGVNLDGGFSEYVAVDYLNLFKISNISNDSCLMEPLACVLNGVNKINPKIGSNVLIVGYGPIGKMFATLLQYNGCNVFVSEINQQRIEALVKDGFDKHHDQLCDIVVEVSGSGQAAIDYCTRYVNKGGEILFFSVPQGKNTIDFDLIFKKELSIYGAFINPDTNLQASYLIDKIKIFDDIEIVSDVFHMKDAKEAFKKASTDAMGKVIITNENFK